MKSLKNTFLILSAFIFAQSNGMQAPTRPISEVTTVKLTFKSLPADVKRSIVPLIASSKVTEVANTILSLNATNKFFHDFISNPAGMISILERMPYTLNALDLVILLRETNLPVIRSLEIEHWFNKQRYHIIGGQQLFDAVAANNIPLVTELLKNKNINFNFRAQAFAGDTVLTKAIEEGYTEIVRLLIAAGVDVNRPNLGGFTPLMVASRHENQTIMRMLLDAGAQVNAQTPGGLSALMIAVNLWQEENIKTLIAAGADITLKDKAGHTAHQMAEQIASEFGNTKILDTFEKALAQKETRKRKNHD